ncbi:MAG: LysR family transcriptional regulator [Caulobacteraceae bacterium]|nr:LysR family transcriptional regulator [Caulobacteraceae bacterium]
MLNWDDLRIFLAVAREGGLLPAARRLGLDHTTVARRISTLEEAVGARLVDRSPRGARLTDAGAGMIEHAERMEAEAVVAGSAWKGADQQASGVVRLATPEAFGAWLVAPAVRAFHDQYPEIQLELVPESRLISLSKRDADLAVMLSRPPQGRLFAQRLIDYELGLFASRAYLEETGAVDSLDALKGRPLVGYIDEMIDIPELRYVDQFANGSKTVFRSTSITAQQIAVSAGLGLGVLHVFAAEQNPQLIRVMAERISIKRSYWLAMHPDQRRLPRVRAVADFLRGLTRAHLRHRG